MSRQHEQVYVCVCARARACVSLTRQYHKYEYYTIFDAIIGQM